MKLKLLKKILFTSIPLSLLSTPAMASVAYQCNGNNTDRTCLIELGSTKDKIPANMITQDTIDAILKQEKKAKKLKIEFSAVDGGYMAYPLMFKNFDNLIIYLDKGATITAIPRDAKSKANGKHNSPWSGVSQFIGFDNCNHLTITSDDLADEYLTNNLPKFDATLPAYFDGQGQDWWKNYKGVDRPVMFDISNLSDLTISNLEFRNSSRAHLSIRGVDGININHVLVHSDSGSPNTDGINIGDVRDVSITNSTIFNGDDNIAINSSGSEPDKNININNIDIHYGHGISLGSNVYNDIQGVNVENITFHNSVNGLRVKTRGDDNGKDSKGDTVSAADSHHSHKSKHASIQDIHYKNITMVDVKKPIIYDFGYQGKDKWSNVKLSNITYDTVTANGSDYPAQFLCDDGNDCSNISLTNVKVNSQGKCQDITLTIDGETKKYKDSQQKCLE